MSPPRAELPPRPVHRAKSQADSELGERARGLGVVMWSAFLAAALATMLCFAFLDPLQLEAGELPNWWSSRLHVYGVGFFFFWLIGLVAAGLCWQLARNGRRNE